MTEQTTAQKTQTAKPAPKVPAPPKVPAAKPGTVAKKSPATVAKTKAQESAEAVTTKTATNQAKFGKRQPAKKQPAPKPAPKAPARKAGAPWHDLEAKPPTENEKARYAWTLKTAKITKAQLPLELYVLAARSQGYFQKAQKA